MHGETHESAKGRGGVTGCRYGLELLVFVRCSSGLPVIWRACTHRMPHVRLLQERQGQNFRKRCRYVADYKQELAQLSQAHRLSQNQPYRIWYLLIWLKSQHYHSFQAVSSMKSMFLNVFGYSFYTIGNCGLVTCQIPGEAVQLDSACLWLLGCVPTRCEVEKDSETSRLGVADLLISGSIFRFRIDFTQYFISDKLKCIAADLYRLPCDACQPWNWMTVLLSQLSRPRNI